MAYLSFADYLQNKTNLTSTEYQSIEDVSVLRLFRDYIHWLVKYSKTQNARQDFTVNELLVQLKVINAYYIYLIDYCKKSKALTKPLMLVPVPGRLTRQDAQQLHFVLPTADILNSVFKNTTINNVLSDSRFINLCVTIFSTSLLLACLALCILLPQNPFTMMALFQVGIGSFLMASLHISRLLSQEDKLRPLTHTPLDKPKHLEMMGILAVVGLACNLGSFIFSAHPITSAIAYFLGALLPLFAIGYGVNSLSSYYFSNNLSKPVAIESLAKLRETRISNTLNEENTKLKAQIDSENTEDSTNSELDSASRAILHSYLATQVLPESHTNKNVLPLDLLEEELNYRADPILFRPTLGCRMP